MMKTMRRGIPSLLKDGTEQIEGAVGKNITACKQLADLTRTSLGPNGMNKMLINHLDKTFVTSDCATIMKEMEVEHPAAKLVVMASQMQEIEIGDGSNFVVVFAGELMAQSEELIRMGLHPSEITAGYVKACKKVMEIIEEKDLCVWRLEEKELFSKESLTKGVLAAIAAKQHGYENFLSGLIADACLTVMPKNTFNFNVDNVRVVKVLGGNILQSEVIKGMVVAHDTIGHIKKVTDAKVAVYTCSIQASDTETKGTVLIHNADELKNFNLSEEKQIESIIKSIADAGVKVLVTGSTVDDMALHFIEKYKLMCIKITSAHDLRRLCRATKAKAHVQMGPPQPESLGFCSGVSVREVGSSKITIFRQDNKDATQLSTVLLRASTHNILNDVERAVDDGVNVIRMMGRDARFVAGGGAFDIELARRLAAWGAKAKGLDQYAIKKFAQALEIIPKTLAENAGLVALDTISQLYAAHEKGQVTTGVDVEGDMFTPTAGTVTAAAVTAVLGAAPTTTTTATTGLKDMSAAGILDLLATKKQGIALAVDAVTTILKVDQIIQAKAAGGPKLGKRPGQGHWDDDD